MTWPGRVGGTMPAYRRGQSTGEETPMGTRTVYLLVTGAVTQAGD